ncbi:MAG: hypothetical protein WB392_04730 [Methanotrichaceae archaeon]
MKKVLLLIPLILLLLLVDNASAAAFFRIIDVSPIHVAPNSEANFTATVKGFGPDGGYVQLIFKNETPGISVNYTEGYKYVLPTGTRKFNCTVTTGSIAPGNYSFDMGIYAQDAKINWRTAYVVVEPLPFVEATPVIPSAYSENGSANPTNVSTPKANMTAPAPTPQKTPALGISAAIMILLLAARRVIKRER